MRTTTSAAVLCAATVLLCGCMSVRTTTDLKPEFDTSLKSPAGLFYVAGLTYVDANATDNSYMRQLAGDYQRRLLPPVRRECVDRYPLLFAAESGQAVPIWIEVSETYTMHDGKVIAWMLGTLTLVPMVIPAPMFQTDRDFRVSVGAWDGGNGAAGGVLRQDFRREEHGWGTILTPLGLITVPGRADFPKVSEAFNFGRFGYNDVPQVAQQVATATARLVAAQEPAFWTARPREQVIQGAAPDIPTALPPPKDAAMPF